MKVGDNIFLGIIQEGLIIIGSLVPQVTLMNKDYSIIENDSQVRILFRDPVSSPVIST